MNRPIRTLLFSTLFPNDVRPSHGIFVETRLKQLLASGMIQTRVLAPVPWFPFRHQAFGEYGKHASVSLREERGGVQVEHPRYLMLPKIGMNRAPYALARAGREAAKRILEGGFEFDLIDAHYFYPDGVSAAMIGRALNKPVVITARGSDINLIARYPGPRAMILEAARTCAAVITVSSALKDALVRLGAASDKITVLRNGVDLNAFYQEDRAAARASVGVSGFAIASVGSLIPTKGHHLVIRALRDIPDAELRVAGIGTAEGELKRLAREIGVSDRVRFLGVVPQARLRTLYSAADCLVLASQREGWPNVLLEAMACGAPVVASDVGGVPEIVTSRMVGVLLDRLSAEGIVRAVSDLRRRTPDRAEVRAHAEKFSWDETTSGQLAIFENCLTWMAKETANA